MIHSLRTLVFVIICLLALSAWANRDPDNNSIHENILSSEIQKIPAQGIITYTTLAITRNLHGSTPAFQNKFIANFRMIADTRLCNERIISLRICRDVMQPPHNFRHYLLLLPANPDDFPDLS